MDKDPRTAVVTGFDKTTGYPKDRFGHLLNPVDDKTGKKHPIVMLGRRLYPLTDPYGLLRWIIGDEDDFICFDFAVLDNGYAVLHSVVNCETSGFIQDLAYVVVSVQDMVEVARQLTAEAVEWCVENEIELEYDDEARNPDGFVISVEAIRDCQEDEAAAV